MKTAIGKLSAPYKHKFRVNFKKYWSYRSITPTLIFSFYVQPPDTKPPDAQPSDAQPASCQPQRPPRRLRELYPAYVVPTWCAPLAQAQYAKTRAADRAARYAARANRANAPPQQNKLAQGIALDNLRRIF
jgi:hypothetical protein